MIVATYSLHGRLWESYSGFYAQLQAHALHGWDIIGIESQEHDHGAKHSRVQKVRTSAFLVKVDRLQSTEPTCSADWIFSAPVISPGSGKLKA